MVAQMSPPKPARGVPFQRVAIAGLLLLTSSLVARTRLLLAGGAWIGKGGTLQLPSMEERAQLRFCTPGGGGGGGGDATTARGGGGGGGGDGGGGGGGSEAGGAPAERQVTWQELDALLAAPAGVHGVQRKAGMPAGWRRGMQHMVNMSPWLHAGLPTNLTEDIRAWLNTTARWRAGELGGGNAQLRSPIPSCHYYVDHRRGVVFVRSTKIGGTTLSTALGFTNHPVACRMRPEECNATCRGRPLCMTYLTDPEVAQRVWRNYTVFTFVRNPWARAVSSFHFIHHRAIRKACRGTFAEFAAAPSLLGDLCYRRLADCCAERYGFVLEHLEPQAAACLFTEDGRPAVDFVGRSERFEEDFAELLALLNSRPRARASPLVVKPVRMLNARRSRSEMDKRREYAQHYLNTTALCDIQRYFRQDFDQLKFPTWEAALCGQQPDARCTA